MSQPRTMLICDDEEELAHELGEYFASHGWNVEVSVTGDHAIDLIRRGLAPVVLITDLRIGSGDGRQVVAVAREVSEERQPAMIIIITGHVMVSAAASDFDGDFLYVKPVDPDEIRADIDVFLAAQGASAVRAE